MYERYGGKSPSRLLFEDAPVHISSVLFSPKLSMLVILFFTQKDVMIMSSRKFDPLSTLQGYGIAILKPTTLKSCSSCRLRRVKCDLKLPVCSNCSRLDKSCDILDMISYSFAVVHELQKENKLLQQQASNFLGQLNSVKCFKNGGVHEFRDTGSPNEPRREPRKDEKPKAMDPLDGLFSEVGSLARQSSNTCHYIGSASGINFTKVFLKQLKYINYTDTEKAKGALAFDKATLYIPFANLPRQNIVHELWFIFIDSIHIFYPIIKLEEFRILEEKMYNSREIVGLSHQGKCVFFLVLAISSKVGESSQKYRELGDLNAANEYFNTALKYFELTEYSPTEGSLESLLLFAIWMIVSKDSGIMEDLWLLTRDIMSLCIRFGMHRTNPRWNLDKPTLESRNRLFWCAFILERLVAVKTGRSLSVRNMAIDASLPDYCEELDTLNDDEEAHTIRYKEIKFQPFFFLIKLMTCSGDILESIYAGKGGKKGTLAIESVYSSFEDLREELDVWLETIIDLYETKLPWVFKTLKLHYCVYSLLLSRPSPFIPIVNKSYLEICFNDSKAYIDIQDELIGTNDLLFRWGSLQNIFTCSITFLFSCCALQVDLSLFAKTHDKMIKLISIFSADAEEEDVLIKIIHAVWENVRSFSQLDNKDVSMVPNFYEKSGIKDSLSPILDDENRQKFVWS